MGRRPDGIPDEPGRPFGLAPLSRSQPLSVRLPLDDVDGMIRRDQGVTGHAAPGGQIRGSPRVVGDDLEPVSGSHLVHAKAELEDELPAADLTGVPAFFQEHLLRMCRPPCLGGTRSFPCWVGSAERCTLAAGPIAAPELVRNPTTSGPLRQSAHSSNHDRMSQGPECAPSSEEHRSGADPAHGRCPLGCCQNAWVQWRHSTRSESVPGAAVPGAAEPFRFQVLHDRGDVSHGGEEESRDRDHSRIR